VENLIYTCVQIAHNFGAVAVVGSPIAGWWLERRKLVVRGLAFLALLGWLVQGASGIGFAATSYFLKGALPEVTGIALGALLVKVSATVLGSTAAGLIWRKGKDWQTRSRIILWQSQLIVAFSALMAAAFLRWYL
jgi:hypothetical protein